MKKKFLCLVVLLSLVLLPVKATDDGLLSNHKDGDKVSSSAIQIGDNLNVEKDIDGIALVMGNSVTVSNKQDYLFAMGNNVNIKEATSKDLFVGGNLVDVDAKNIARDVYASGNTINIKSKVARDLYAAASKVTINDGVGGNVKIGAETVVVKGVIDGDAYLDCNDITIEDDAVIAGKLSYPKNAKVSISKDAQIGETDKFDQKEVTKENPIVTAIKSKLFAYLKLLVIGLLAIALFHIKPKKKEKLDSKYITGSMVKGLIILLLGPVAFIALLLVPFGIGMGLDYVLFLVYLLLIYLSAIPVALYLGNTLLGNIENDYLRFALVLLVIYAIRFIPILGGIVTFLVLLFGIGILYNYIVDTYMKKETKK